MQTWKSGVMQTEKSSSAPFGLYISALINVAASPGNLLYGPIPLSALLYRQILRD